MGTEVDISPEEFNNGLGIAEYPAWTPLTSSPVEYAYGDHRVDIDIDSGGYARVRVKPGYDLSAVADIRYKIKQT